MPIPRPERHTQDRVIQRLTTPVSKGGLGYAKLGDWSQESGNRCIEADYLRANLLQRGYSEAQINQALQQLLTAADVSGTTLYEANRRTYSLLRYGIPVQVEVGAPYETVHLIDWTAPAQNHFAIAEEVTLKGGHERRPDLVLFVNGIAIAVIELKRSSVDIANGIRQLITNQEPLFNQAFFSTVQLLLAGSDSQGLRYGTTGTPEQFFVEWKPKLQRNGAIAAGELLDAPLCHLLEPTRLLDLVRNFVIFDAGQKKVPRLHQYEGVKAAQARLSQREGGVIWHTQGSGKSILMVLLAQWLLEHDPEARILVMTDRDELDRQIEGVMKSTGLVSADSPSPRIQSRDQLIEKLGSPSPRLLCALINKIDPKDLNGEPPKVMGRFYVFVDECHRTQGGNMNRQMKRWLSNAIFVGFTGTPLLRRDKQTTAEIFGTFIHTYKFNQAVMDQVVLDLKYEARAIPQQLTSRQAIDEWFDAKTRGLGNYQKSIIRQRWATLESLMSSSDRKQRIIADIVHDFGVKPRLSSDRGTAILVASSIYDACDYYRLFQNTPFGSYCGLITSYQPQPSQISQEPPNSDERFKFDTYTKYVLTGSQSTEQYELEMKRRFIEEPAKLKLLIVVSKLLTGFDAPSCTYIYLDNELRDHNLFQAICRTNRLDGDDKDFGYIVDYKELLRNVQEAISVYTSDELDLESCGEDGNVVIKDWLEEGKARLDAAREALHYHCEPVPPPRDVEQFIYYFCGSASNTGSLDEKEPLRIGFYKATAAYIRAYSAIVTNLSEAGYTAAEIEILKQEAKFYKDMRDAVKRNACEELDIKPFEGDMRHLINTYIQAESSDRLGDLSDLSLTKLIVKTGIHDAIAKQLNRQNLLSRKAIAEGIINNLRKVIVKDQLTDPRFYAQMSKLLEELIQQSREETAEYEEFLKKAEALAKQVEQRQSEDALPVELQDNPTAAALYRNLPEILAQQNRAAEPSADYGQTCLDLTLKIDQALREKAPADWRGDEAREKQVLNALFPLLNRDRDATLAVFAIIKNQAGY
ncbi:type I restriction endonuclease subunit R (plasmid) [Synechococcus elongatus IITB7]|uniref:type I restriction endonuclease subunit R n=1 Tax=Synechococcus elongatus TaxID=32046 RepID=UPI0030CD3F20